MVQFVSTDSQNISVRFPGQKDPGENNHGWSPIVLTDTDENDNKRGFEWVVILEGMVNYFKTYCPLS